MEHLKTGVKPDTFSALRNCPLNTHALFPDAVIRKAEDEIQQFETIKRTNQPGPGRGGFAGNHKNPTPLTGSKDRNLLRPVLPQEKTCPHGSPLGDVVGLEAEEGEVSPVAAPALLGIKGSINDNYCVPNPVPVARSKINVINVIEQNFSVSVQQPVFCPVASPVPFVVNVRGQSQKKDTSPSSRNKICQRCFFCRSLRFCPHCSKCPQCCQCSSDRGTSPKILAEVVPPRFKPESSVHFEGRLHSPIQSQTPTSKGPPNSQWLCKPPQEPLPEGGFASLTTKGGSRDGKGSDISSLLQPTVHSPKTKPKVATSLGPQCSKQIFERKNIQDGNPGNNSDLTATGRMGDIAGFQ